jgi:hypothetical protein
MVNVARASEETGKFLQTFFNIFPIGIEVCWCYQKKGNWFVFFVGCLSFSEQQE